MTFNKIRSLLYKAARVLGDVQAVRRGRVGQRIGNKILGRVFGKLMGRR